MKFFFKIIPLIICPFFLACAYEYEQAAYAEPNCLIMYYADGDNNLERNIMLDLNEMEGVDLRANKVKIIALVDRADGHWSGDGNWTDTRAYEIGSDSFNDGFDASFDSATKRIEIPELHISKTGKTECNMGDEKTLEKFVSFCLKKYPNVKSKILLFSNHGGGWRNNKDGITQNNFAQFPYKSICWDDSSSQDFLETKEVARALLLAGCKQNPLDLIVFDACLMANLEFITAIKDYAHYFVGSVNNISGIGFPYTQIFKDLSKEPELNNSLRICEIIVKNYAQVSRSGGAIECPNYTNENFTISVLSLDKMTTVVNDFYLFIDSLKEFPQNEVIKARLFSEFYSTNGSLVDLYDFCQQSLFANNIYAQNLKKSLDSAVLFNERGCLKKESGGLSFYFPVHSWALDDEYISENVKILKSNDNWKLYLDAFYKMNYPEDPLELAINTEKPECVGNNTLEAAYYNRSFPGIQLIDSVKSKIISKNDIDCFYYEHKVKSCFSVKLVCASQKLDYNLELYGIDLAGKINFIGRSSNKNTDEQIDCYVTKYEGYLVKVYPARTCYSSSQFYELEVENK